MKHGAARGARTGESPDEGSLVERSLAGDQHAFAELAGAHRAKLWSICLRITGNEYDAEDALQDALTAAWLNLHKFRRHSRFSTWAFRIAANSALAVVRKRRDSPTDDVESLDVHVGDDFTDALADRDRVNSALAQLSDPFREALVLREYGDLAYASIAQHQGVGVQTVKSRISRARSAVAAELVHQDDDTPER